MKAFDNIACVSHNQSLTKENKNNREEKKERKWIYFYYNKKYTRAGTIRFVALNLSQFE